MRYALPYRFKRSLAWSPLVFPSAFLAVNTFQRPASRPYFLVVSSAADWTSSSFLSAEGGVRFQRDVLGTRRFRNGCEGLQSLYACD